MAIPLDLPPFLLFRYSATDDLDCDGEDLRAARNSGFVTFVEKTLFSCDCKLKKFKVVFEYEPRFASNVDSWTRFTAGKGVEELYLQLWPADTKYELPQLLVIPEGNVAWYSLKKLSIGYLKFSNDVIERILAGSPVLETLELDHWEGFSRLDVTNSCMKKLILREFLDIWLSLIHVQPAST
ncbi:hypothetical protein C3L33_06305, partial [Rhododendron williamsianum]